MFIATECSIDQEMELTNQQSRLLVALMAGQGGKYSRFVSSSHLAFILGGKGKWSNYRHVSMRILESRGITLCMRVSRGKAREWHYSLTEEGAKCLSDLVTRIVSNG